MEFREALETIVDSRAALPDRIAAAGALSASREPEALSALITGASTTNEELRDAAIASMKKLGATETFSKRLGDASASEAARVEAANGLRLLRDPGGEQALVIGLKASEPAVRAASAHALAVSGAAGAIEALTGALEDPSSDVRYYAIIALSESPSPAVSSALKKRLAVEQDAVLRDELERVLQSR